MNANRCCGLDVNLKGPLGTLAVDLPSNRSLGHKYVSSSGDVGCLPMGLSLIKFAISNKTVCSSEKVRMLSWMAVAIALLTDFTRASETPFCQGASAVVNSHWKPSMFPNAFNSSQSHPLVTLFSSLLAATS